jgi:hypothetical protein
MSRDLLELILPRLARRLNRQLRRFQSGQLDESQFSQRFELLLQQQHLWLANQGHSELAAAVAVHAAVLVLSGAGLRAEADDEHLPLEVVEFRAVCAAAADIAEHFGVSKDRAIKRISSLVASYAE